MLSRIFGAAEGTGDCSVAKKSVTTGIDWFDNGVDHDYFDPAGDYPWVATGDGPLIVFTGQMDYRPNIEAVESFARTSLPAIRAVHPQARFAIWALLEVDTVRIGGECTAMLGHRWDSLLVLESSEVAASRRTLRRYEGGNPHTALANHID